MVLNFKNLAILFATALCCGAVPIDGAPGSQISSTALEAYPNQYMVRLTPNMEQTLFDSTLDLVRTALGQDNQLRFTYFFSDFRGFSMEASTTVLNSIANIPGVVDVEPNWIYHQQQEVHQRDSTYGLDRISHRTNAGVVNRPLEFTYFQPDGAGTFVYVIDSGIYAQNLDFTGRVTKGENYAPPNVFGNPNTFTDFTGHGTHVASIAAGHNYGVAKYANIIDVKVFNDNGTAGAESITAGISYAANTAQQRGEVSLSVLQMSFGAHVHPRNNIIGYATQSAINAGLFCSIAAGNAALNADLFTPADVQDACTVGATDSTDLMADFSNYGQTVDIWAPGVDIPAAGIGFPAEVVNKSGTSMASPYVGGVAAYLKSFNSFIGYSPVELCQILVNEGSRGYITFQSFANPPGPNVLLYDLGGKV